MGKIRINGEKSKSPVIKTVKPSVSVKTEEILLEVEKMIAATPVPEKVIEKTETVIKEVSKVDTRSRKYARAQVS